MAKKAKPSKAPSTRDVVGAQPSPSKRRLAAAKKGPSFFERNRKMLGSFLIFGLWFGCLVIMGMVGEGWTFVTSLYVGTQIVTTVGYGDIHVSHNFHMMMCIFCLTGIAVVANILNDLCSVFLDMQMETVRAKMRQVEALASDKIKDVDQAKEQLGHWNALLGAFFIFSFFVLGGAGFFAYFEPCSCSYGVTAIPGCVEGADCAGTGGTKVNFGIAFYMAVITLTTVGFGDVTPVSESGRIFSIAWMFLGVIATANFVTAISDFIGEKKSSSSFNESFDRKVFERLDVDNSGGLSRGEFKSWVLIKEGLVTSEDLKRLDDIFNAIDTNKNQSLSYEECQTYFRPDMEKKTGRSAAAREISGGSLAQPLYP